MKQTYKKLMYVRKSGTMQSYAIAGERGLTYVKGETTIAVHGPLSAYKNDFPYTRPMLIELQHYKHYSEVKIELWSGRGIETHIPKAYTIMEGNKDDYVEAPDFQVALLEFTPLRKLG